MHNTVHSCTVTKSKLLKNQETIQQKTSNNFFR